MSFDPNSLSRQQWAEMMNLPVGEILRRMRVHYGLQLHDVELALRIRAVQIDAIERGDMDRLPGRVYAIGFVRAYAEFLGLEGDKIVHLFKAQLVGNKARPELQFPVSASESKLPGKYILAASFMALLVLVGGAALWRAGGTSETYAIPDVPGDMIRAEDRIVFGPPAPTASHALSAIEPAAGVDPQEKELLHRIEIRAQDDVWVEIRDSQRKVLLSRVLKPGDSYLVPDQDGLVMDTGNVGALVFLLDGEDLSPRGENGDIIRGMALSPEALLPQPLPETTDHIAHDIFGSE